MVIDLKQVFEIESEAVALDHKMDLTDYPLWGNTPFVSPVQIKGGIRNRAGVVTLEAEVRYLLSFPCDRCLRQVEREYSFTALHTLVSELAGEDDETFVLLPEMKLELDELILSDILLELPTKLLCKKSCKGLCPTCGTDLNESTCDCGNRPTENALSGLLALLDEDSE
ncbi:MAG: DUF177 domain-containing protein [Oscillospiraceae bacterium]|nr:DUF177 domain-containing protein [Oscillospiraceae bacterium]MBQ8732716.1 DUF177 domain-containing protein [Oscillospiraceae bacterium]